MAELDLIDILHEEITASAMRMGMTQVVAADHALAVERGIRDRCGGERLYIATNSKAARNSFIFVEWSGGALVADIASRHELDLSLIYKILRSHGAQFGK
jgi:Mor family transcriptional regulator